MAEWRGCGELAEIRYVATEKPGQLPQRNGVVVAGDVGLRKDVPSVRRFLYHFSRAVGLS